jgi:hypothetical protein
MAKHTTPEIDQLRQLRDHHLAEARRCDDAMILLRNIGGLVRKAQQLTGKASARADADPLPATTPARPKRGKKPRQLRKIEGVSSATRSARRAKTGSRPTDVIRRQFSAAGAASIERGELLASLVAVNQPVPHRVLGVVIKQMMDRREIKRGKDGTYTAWRLQPPAGQPEVAPPNGAHG